MSLDTARTEIAAILSTVDGVVGSAYRPSVLRQGVGWPQIGDLQRSDEVPDFLVTWRVIIVLPADEVAAAKWFDAHVGDIAAAFDLWGYVDALTPGTVATTGGDLHALFVTIRREV